MANQTLDVRIIHRNDTKTNWELNNPILLKGEKGIEIDTNKEKVGDGITDWNSLNYSNVTPDDIESFGLGDMSKSNFATNSKADDGYVDKAIVADYLNTSRTISISGDATGSTSFDGTTNKNIELVLTDSGAAVGTYPKVTIDTKGRVTSGESLVANDIPNITLAKITDANTIELLTNKGVSNGYAGLDENTKLLMENMPDAIVGQMVHAGEFNASAAIATLTTNGKAILGITDAAITLTNDTTAKTGYVDNQGNYFVTTVAGNFAGIEFVVGDWLVANASGWSKIDNTDAVVSVNGKTGLVTLITDDVEEGTNLYYTDSRATSNFNKNFALKSSNDLADGSTILHIADTLILNGGEA